MATAEAPPERRTVQHPGVPGFSKLYRIGKQANAGWDHACTLRELGDELGVTPQNAYTESVLALGKLIWLLRVRLGVEVR